MRREHSECDDSDVVFSTPNYIWAGPSYDSYMGWAESHADLRRITPKKPGAGPGMNRWDQLYSSTSWLPAKKAAKKAAATELEGGARSNHNNMHPFQRNTKIWYQLPVK